MPRPSKIAILIALALATLGASAVFAAPATVGQLRSMSIISPRWVYLDADMPIGVRVVTHASTGSVRAELDLLDSTGASRWHTVQTRTDLGSVTYEYSFFRRVADIGLSAGIYTLRIRVSGSHAPMIERTSPLVIVDRQMRAVPVCVVVRVTGTPSAGPAASLAETTASQLSAADAADLGRLAVLHPELHLSIAVPPFLLDEWRTSAGSGDGTASPGPWSDALESLRRASQAGVPMMRGMYSDPDLIGIASSTEDLTRQLEAGDVALTAELTGEGVSPSVTATGLAVLSGPLPEGAAIVAAGHGIRFAVVDTTSVLPASSATSASGAYAVVIPARHGSLATTMTLLAIDRSASRSLLDPAALGTLTEDIFERATSNRSARTVVIEVPVGPDGTRTPLVEQALGTLSGLPWVRFVDAPEAAAATRLPKATLRTLPKNTSPAPPGYWATIDAARERVSGLLAAAGANDKDAAQAANRLLLAESRAWAGTDGSWSLAARGLALATAADDAARAVLSKVTLDAPAVTLPGSEGKAPVSITNASGRTLTVVLEASSNGLRVRQARTTVHLKPGENVLSIPVALGTAPSGRLTVTVTAGGFRIATSTATVRASYQDRIVLMVTVVLILVGLLFYIRRRIAHGPSERATESLDA